MREVGLDYSTTRWTASGGGPRIIVEDNIVLHADRDISVLLVRRTPRVDSCWHSGPGVSTRIECPDNASVASWLLRYKITVQYFTKPFRYGHGL